MKKSFWLIFYFAMGVTIAIANQSLTCEKTTSSLLMSQNCEEKMEYDTISTTLDEWEDVLEKKSKEGWYFRALIYQKDKEVLLIIERPIQEKASPVSSRINDYLYRYTPNQPDFIEDAYFESLLGVIHVVNNKIVEWVEKR